MEGASGPVRATPSSAGRGEEVRPAASLTLSRPTFSPFSLQDRPAATVNSAAFHATEDLLYTAGDDHNVVVYDIAVR